MNRKQFLAIFEKVKDHPEHVTSLRKLVKSWL